MSMELPSLKMKWPWLFNSADHDFNQVLVKSFDLLHKLDQNIEGTKTYDLYEFIFKVFRCSWIILVEDHSYKEKVHSLKLFLHVCKSGHSSQITMIQHVWNQLGFFEHFLLKIIYAPLHPILLTYLKFLCEICKMEQFKTFLFKKILECKEFINYLLTITFYKSGKISTNSSEQKRFDEFILEYKAIVLQVMDQIGQFKSQ